MAYRAAYAERHIILVMTGTDLYREIKRSRQATAAMEAADVLITLQPDGIRALPPVRKHRKRHGMFRMEGGPVSCYSAIARFHAKRRIAVTPVR
jgi:hypothetical protein